MPLPLLAVAAANAATLFSYNRQNFMYNKGQQVQRAFTGLSYKLQQFQLYRQDIRDLAALTTVRMTHYHVVGALELGMCATLLGPGRLPDEVPSWLLWHQLVALCAAFAYLVVSMWLATRAAVAAESFNVRLQTQWIRLPLPDDALLDSALTRAEEFESEGLKDMLRVPFMASVFRRAFHSTAEAASAAEEAEAAAGDSSTGAPAAASPAASTAAGPASPRQAGGRVAGGGGAPATGSGGKAGAASGGERRDEQLPGCPTGPQVSMSSLTALHFYQQLQRNWSCFDAYSRVCMSVGTYWLILSLAYYHVGYTLCHLGKPLPAVAAAIMLTGVAILLVYVDLFAGRVKLMATSALLLAGPICVSIGASLQPLGSVETPLWSVAVGVVHMALSIWFWHEGSIVPGKADLPIRFRGVVYLDIFGPVVRQLRSFLDSSGLGQHAWAEFSDSDEEEARPESAEDARAQAEVGGLASQEVLLELGQGEAGGARMQEVATARSKLSAALVHEGPSSQRRRLLGEALQAAYYAGVNEADAQVRKAQCLLAKVSFPSDVRRMRRLLQDWRNGIVDGYLDEVQRRELWRMCEDIDILYARLKLKPVEATGMPRSMTLDSAGTAGFTPAWTRVSHDTNGYGDEKDAYEYWVGTAQGGQGSNCQFGAPPPGVRCEEFEDVRARCADLLARAEYFACEAAARTGTEKRGDWAKGMLGGCLSMKEREHDRNRHRKGHQPVVSYRAMCAWLLAMWFLGTLVHLAQVREVRRMFMGGSTPLARRLRQEEEEVAGASSPLSHMALVRPQRFFRPHGLKCIEAATAGASPSHRQPHLVASNGFLVYRLGSRDQAAEAEASVEIPCPVAAHDALVMAACGADGRGCRAVVAAADGLWNCSGAREAAAQPLASLPRSLTAGTRAPLRHWAAADAELGTLFAAPARGPILQLRRSGAALRLVAELQAPTEAPKVDEWLMLSVERGSTLIALAMPGPTILAWSLASGKYLGSRDLDASVRGVAGWCTSPSGDLYRLEDSIQEGLEVRWASWSGL